MVYGLYVLSPGHRAFWPPSPAKLFRKLDTSIGVSGPHDFTVRARIARLARRTRPSLPDSHVRGDWPNAPPVESGCSETIIYFRKTEDECFCSKGLTLLLIKRNDLP